MHTCKQQQLFTRKAEEEWEAMRLENAMQGNGTSLFEVGAA